MTLELKTPNMHWILKGLIFFQNKNIAGKNIILWIGVDILYGKNLHDSNESLKKTPDKCQKTFYNEGRVINRK